MSNDFYNSSGSPSTGSTGSSAVMRSEFTAVQSAFDKLAALTGNGGKLLRVNSGGTAYETINLNAGQILYGGASNGVAQSNNFTWNTTNNTLAITGNVGISGNVLTTGTVGNTTGRVGTGYFVNINANGAVVLSSTLNVSGQADLNNLNVTNFTATQGIRSTGSVLAAAVGNSAVLDFFAPAARINSLGNSPSTRGKFQVLLRGSDASNTLTALDIDEFGNTRLNNLNLAGVLTGTPSMLSPLNNSLAADVNMNNSNLFFDGPSVAQGNNGTWFASGKVSILDPSATATTVTVKLWDGSTVIDSAVFSSDSTKYTISCSGFIASPTGNIRMSVQPDLAGTRIAFNSSGLGKDSTITAIRIG